MGECVALVGASGASAEAGGGWRMVAGAGHALLVLLARGGGRLAGASGLGRAGGLGGLCQVSLCSLSPFLFFIYSIISVTSGLYLKCQGISINHKINHGYCLEYIQQQTF